MTQTSPNSQLNQANERLGGTNAIREGGQPQLTTQNCASFDEILPPSYNSLYSNSCPANREASTPSRREPIQTVIIVQSRMPTQQSSKPPPNYMKASIMNLLALFFLFILQLVYCNAAYSHYFILNILLSLAALIYSLQARKCIRLNLMDKARINSSFSLIFNLASLISASILILLIRIAINHRN